MSWKTLATARGQAEPPITTFLRWGNLLPVPSRCCSSISQTVGTAAVQVTLKRSSNSKTDAPSSLAPGITREAPAIGAANIIAQQLAWNMGTTGITTSRDEYPFMSELLAISPCRTLERCE